MLQSVRTWVRIWIWCVQRNVGFWYGCWHVQYVYTIKVKYLWCIECELQHFLYIHLYKKLLEINMPGAWSSNHIYWQKNLQLTECICPQFLYEFIQLKAVVFFIYPNGMQWILRGQIIWESILKSWQTIRLCIFLFWEFKMSCSCGTPSCNLRNFIIRMLQTCKLQPYVAWALAWRHPFSLGNSRGWSST